MRHVVVPQAVRRVLPPLLNHFVALEKDTELISVLGAVDVVRAAQIGVYQDVNYTPSCPRGSSAAMARTSSTRHDDGGRNAQDAIRQAGGRQGVLS